MTPEGKVKARIKRILIREGVYSEMPVPSGYGKSGLDYNCCVCGFWLSIEAKAPGKKPTKRQLATMRAIRKAGGVAIVCDGNYEIVENAIRRLKHGATKC